MGLSSLLTDLKIGPLKLIQLMPAHARQDGNFSSPLQAVSSLEQETIAMPI